MQAVNLAIRRSWRIGARRHRRREPTLRDEARFWRSGGADSRGHRGDVQGARRARTFRGQGIA